MCIQYILSFHNYNPSNASFTCMMLLSQIYVYVLQGRLSEARHLLSLHPDRKQDTHNVS